MKNSLYIILSTILLFSCNSENKKLESSKWLLGNWKQESLQGTFTESWTIKNENSFTGNSYFILGTDTLFSEKVNLIERGNDLFYVVTLLSDTIVNDTEFKLTHQTDNTIIFENQKNDFPKKILYKKINNDSIYAEISGGGNPQQFPLTRIK